MHTTDILKSHKYSEKDFKNSIKTGVLQMATPWIFEICVLTRKMNLSLNVKYQIRPDKRFCSALFTPTCSASLCTARLLLPHLHQHWTVCSPSSSQLVSQVSEQRFLVGTLTWLIILIGSIIPRAIEKLSDVLMKFRGWKRMLNPCSSPEMIFIICSPVATL